MGNAKVVVRPTLLETPQKSGVSNLCSLACTGLGISAGPSRTAGAPRVQGTKPLSTARVTARHPPLVPPPRPLVARPLPRCCLPTAVLGLPPVGACVNPFPAQIHGLPHLFLIFLLSSFSILAFRFLLPRLFLQFLACSFIIPLHYW